MLSTQILSRIALGKVFFLEDFWLVLLIKREISTKKRKEKFEWMEEPKLLDTKKNSYKRRLTKLEIIRRRIKKISKKLFHYVKGSKNWEILYFSSKSSHFETHNLQLIFGDFSWRQQLAFCGISFDDSLNFFMSFRWWCDDDDDEKNI